MQVKIVSTKAQSYFCWLDHLHCAQYRELFSQIRNSLSTSSLSATLSQQAHSSSSPSSSFFAVTRRFSLFPSASAGSLSFPLPPLSPAGSLSFPLPPLSLSGSPPSSSAFSFFFSSFSFVFSSFVSRSRSPSSPDLQVSFVSRSPGFLRPLPSSPSSPDLQKLGNTNFPFHRGANPSLSLGLLSPEALHRRPFPPLLLSRRRRFTPPTVPLNLSLVSSSLRSLSLTSTYLRSLFTPAAVRSSLSGVSHPLRICTLSLRIRSFLPYFRCCSAVCLVLLCLVRGHRSASRLQPSTDGAQRLSPHPQSLSAKDRGAQKWEATHCSNALNDYVMAAQRLSQLRRVLAYRVLPARYFASASYSATDFGAQSECSNFNINNINDGFGKVGHGFQGELSFAASFNDDDVEEDDDDECGEGESSSSDDESLEVIGSFRGNHERRENIARVEIEENEFRHPLVREVCRLITLRSSWNPKLEGHLRHLLRSLKPPHVCAVLRSQVDERVALSFFYWADRQWRYRHSTIVYYTLLDVLSKTKLCQGARRILRLLTRRGFECPPEAFGYVMVSYSRAGKLRNALRVLTLMQKAGVEPNLSICNTAIYVLVKGNKLVKALRFLERMRITGIEPDIVTYNCLIKGYCDLGRIEDALKLIAEMPSKGCPPDKVSYYTVLAFLCKEKKIEEVKQLMESMVSDSKLIPDQVSYNTLIHMLSKHGHADDALNFLREAEDKGFHIDKVGYSAIVHSFCKEGRMDEAKSLVNNMYSRGCIPDVVTYTAIINGFCRTGKIDEAKKMLQHMYKHGCKPNTVSYTALLNGLCHNGKSLEAREMIMVSEEHWWTPNAVTYSAVMHGLRREGKLSEACDLIREMVEKGFFPTPVEINLLIQAFCRNQKVVDAKFFLQECLNKGCAVNVVNFTTVIHGFCQTGDLEAALSMLDDMYLSNKHPDAVTYTALFDALGKKGRLDEAAELIMKMLSRGLNPTPVTYRAVIHRYCQWGRVDDMLKLLEKMLARQPFGTVYNQVIEKLCDFGNLDEAEKLLGKVLRTASKLDANTCHVLMESYLTKGIALPAYKVACRMFSRNLIPDLKLCEKVSKRLMLEGKLVEADNLMIRLVERGIQQNEMRMRS